MWVGDWDTISKNYVEYNAPHKHPPGFKEYWAQYGIASPNSCAARIGYAIVLADSQFFRTAKHRSWIASGDSWKSPVFGRMPQLAKDLAIILNERIGIAKLAARSPLAERQGILFFDTIRGYVGSGHISLWDRSTVVDGGDYFDRSPRAYFWELSAP